jgi:hypothetical protein
VSASGVSGSIRATAIPVAGTANTVNISGNWHCSPSG